MKLVYQRHAGDQLWIESSQPLHERCQANLIKVASSLTGSTWHPSVALVNSNNFCQAKHTNIQMSSRLKNNWYLVSNLHRPLGKMRYCSASLGTLVEAGAQKKQSPPAQHSALISGILHPAWLGAGCGPSRSSTCKWKTYHAFNTQLKEVLLETLALTHNKGSVARTWKDTNPLAFCWLSLMKCCCLCCTSTWLITKPQILAAGHVRLHCPWPWWTRKDKYPHLKPLRTAVSQSTW